MPSCAIRVHWKLKVLSVESQRPVRLRAAKGVAKFEITLYVIAYVAMNVLFRFSTCVTFAIANVSLRYWSTLPASAAGSPRMAAFWTVMPLLNGVVCVDRSAAPKKKVLSATIRPPRLPPHCSRSKADLGSPCFADKKSSPLSDLFRK